MNKPPVLCVELRYHQILNLSGFLSVNHNASRFSPMAGLSFSFPGSTKTVIIFSSVFQLLNAGSQAELCRQEIEGGFFAEADSLKGKPYSSEDDSKKESSQKHRDLLMSTGNQMCPTHAQSL